MATATGASTVGAVLPVRQAMGAPRNFMQFKPEEAKRDKIVKGIAGTKYSELGHRKPGISSVLDTDIVRDNLEKIDRNVGNVAYTITLKKKDGTPYQYGSIRLGDRVFYADEKGDMIFIDKDNIEYRRDKLLEREQYVSQVSQYCSVDDELTADILNMSVENLRLICASNGLTDKAKFSAEDFTNAGIAPALDSYDCTPSFMASLPKGMLLDQASAKLRAIIKWKMPIMEHSSTEKTIHAGVE